MIRANKSSFNHKKRIALLFYLFTFSSLIQAFSQKNNIQVALRPEQIIVFQNTELTVSQGFNKWRLGIIGSYLPASQNSGELGSAGQGLTGSYGNPHFHKAYRMYTAGIYAQYNLKSPLFIAAEILYRNWYFNKKDVSYDNPEGYSFDATRTDNIDVALAKFYLGFRSYTKGHFYIDGMLGFGIRKQWKYYQTFNGTVNGVFYEYLEERETYTWGTPQVGVKLGWGF